MGLSRSKNKWGLKAFVVIPVFYKLREDPYEREKKKIQQKDQTKSVRAGRNNLSEQVLSTTEVSLAFVITYVCVCMCVGRYPPKDLAMGVGSRDSPHFSLGPSHRKSYTGTLKQEKDFKSPIPPKVKLRL